MTEEQSLMRHIMLALGKFRHVRLFRNNTGTGWVGETVKRYTQNGSTYLVLKNPRPLVTGLCVGSSDLIGWTSVKISPEMIGQTLAVFTALEVKTKTGRATAQQTAFIETVKRFGGIAGIPRNTQDAESLFLYGKE
jgi:hypothetical protein